MGSTQSSHAKKHEVKSSPSKKGSLSLPSDVRGRKSSIVTKGVPHGLKASIVSVPSDHFEHFEHFDEEETHGETLHSDEEHHLTDEDTVDSDYESEEEEEDDEEWEERLRILEDARKLKQVAEFFAHPEAPVTGATGSRCFFDRPSAPERLSREEADEQAAILEDAKALKELATAYHHPEAPVVTTDANATARNYFERPSAPVQETFEEAEERAAVLRDAAALKQAAVDFLHPERPVAVDATACGRNYFTRASAPEYDTEEDAEERERIMEDLKSLKQAAVDYLHPERPVVVDATACGRNYFTRLSAPEYETEEDAEERERIMEDLKSLKQAAVDYLHPERPVAVDATACGRNYFTRASAPEYDTEEDAEERERIMEDLKMLKQAATDYLHPEIPCVTTDPTACGRNYFSRASAPEYETEEDAEVRAQVLEDMMAFKKLAVAYRHPELKVEMDDTASARNYFSRASAPEYESLEDAEVRAQVMEDMQAFKQLAVAYRHPELSIGVHSTAYGRNYFSRASAPEQESPEEAEERAAIMEDLMALKQSAKNWMHPEIKVETTDAFACGRNYFSRPSAPEQESLEEAEERAAVMEDLMALKQSAKNWMHPEVAVETTDAFACGRNYFSRPSAPEQESPEEAEERAAILRDVAALKQAAKAYLHPEVGVVTSDPTSTGRNFFNRPSSSVHHQMIHSFPPHEDDDTEHHHEHLDHFGMDEDMELLAMREELAPALEHPGKPVVDEAEVGSNLSRSPSSVMLAAFD